MSTSFIVMTSAPATLISLGDKPYKVIYGPNRKELVDAELRALSAAGLFVRAFHAEEPRYIGTEVFTRDIPAISSSVA